MKILILQLARFGDIVQTWPSLRALRKKYPDAQLHLMVREKYQAAAQLVSEVDFVHQLPTKAILAPTLFSNDPIADALVELDKYLDDLPSHFDEIINLSFSPFSSYLVEELKSEETHVRGYDRYSDGYLSIPDDPSAYFYAQVGVGRANRLHVTDLFAMVSGVELKQEDRLLSGAKHLAREDRPYIVLHTGASQSHKSLDSEQWSQVVRLLLLKTDFIIYTVGTEKESLRHPWLETQNRYIDLCGKTEISELFPLIAGSKALVAGDSLMIQVANMLGIRSFNLSFESVNFWETGPTAEASRVFLSDSPAKVDMAVMMKSMMDFLDNRLPGEKVYLTKFQNNVHFEGASSESSNFQWKLIQAMYMGMDYPILEDFPVAQAFAKINELAELGLENVVRIAEVEDRSVFCSILDQVDLMLQSIAEQCEEVSPLVRWFLAEKSRIGPVGFEEILAQTANVFEQLRIVSNMYCLKEELPLDMAAEDLTWK